MQNSPNRTDEGAAAHEWTGRRHRGQREPGPAVTADLAANGWQVVNVDTTAPAEQTCPFVKVDLTDS